MTFPIPTTSQWWVLRFLVVVVVVGSRSTSDSQSPILEPSERAPGGGVTVFGGGWVVGPGR